jgi:thiol:disulfide interchange protein
LAIFPAAAAQDDRHISVEMIVETSQPQPGEAFDVGIVMTPEDGWHGYWRNPGDAGVPITAKWSMPRGFEAGELRHPTPSALELAGFTSYVHKGAFTLVTNITAPEGVAPGARYPVELDLNWLACSDTLCVPEQATLKTELIAGDGTKNARAVSILQDARAKLPASADHPLSIRNNGDQWEFSFGKGLVERPDKARLFPLHEGWFKSGASQVAVVDRDTVTIRVPRLDGTAPEESFVGVLTDGTNSYKVSAEVPAELAQRGGVAGAIERVEGQGESMTVWAAFAAAVLGGVILNLMPCVFPILSLKALALARVGADRRMARIEGVAYTAGSIATALGLGVILLLLRGLGAEVGWAFQLQNPTIVLLLLALSAVIGFNFAGLFEIGAPPFLQHAQDGRGAAGAFATGGLAALIATPCSGPFMGAALGAALILSPAGSLMIFAGLGLGMALPFLLIALAPAAQRLLPRPGAWMVTLRRWLSLPMFATSLGLAWVLGRQTGVGGMALGLGFATALTVVLWWIGLRQRNGEQTSVREFSAIAAATAVLFISPGINVSPNPSATENSVVYETFSPGRLSELRAEGTAVFVDFTADWCLTCKVNEKIAIETEPVQQAFAENDVVTLRGDWTTERHQRNSIPFYLYYAPGSEGRQLPQILSKDLLISLADSHGSGADGPGSSEGGL